MGKREDGGRRVDFGCAAAIAAVVGLASFGGCSRRDPGAGAVGAGEAEPVATASVGDRTDGSAAPPAPCPLERFLADREEMRLARSFGRASVPGPGADFRAAVIEVHADAVYANGARSALIVERDGVREVEERAKAGGRASFLILDLKEQLEIFKASLQEIERVEGLVFNSKGWALIVMDGATPYRIVKEVLYTTREAGYERFFFGVRRARAVGDASPAASCPDHALLSVRRSRPSEARRVSREEYDALQARIQNTLSLEAILGSGSEDGEGGPEGDDALTKLARVPTGGVRMPPPRPAGGTGQMDRNVFMAQLARRRAGMERCYDDALARDPAIQGDVTFIVAIDAQGAVAVELALDDPALREAGVTACVEARLAALDYTQTPPVGGDFRVRLPFSFRPPAEPTTAMPAGDPSEAPLPGVASAPGTGEVASATAPEPAAPAPAPEASPLGLVVVLTRRSMTLMADRGLAAEVMPEDPVTGTRGRLDIPHLALPAQALVLREAEACRTSPDSAECSWWRYASEFVETCEGGEDGAARVPDLLAYNAALGTIADAAGALGERTPADRWTISIKAEDDIPFCQIVALMDFARFRRVDFDWTEDGGFAGRPVELQAAEDPDPTTTPEFWDDATRAALLFPVVGFIN